MSNHVSPTVFQESSNYNENKIDVSMLATGSIRNRDGSAHHIIYDDGMAYTVLRTLVDRHTGKQQISIYATRPYGNTLWLNNTLMSSAFDQRLYHELMVAPVCVLSHVWCTPRIRNALVLGVGPGGILPVLLPFLCDSVRNVCAVDLDSEVCKEARNHLADWSKMPDGSSAFDSLQVEFRETDALSYATKLVEAGKHYDLIVCDMCAGAEQFPDAFLCTLKALMSEVGIVVSHFGPAGMLGKDNARRAYHRFCSLGDARMWQAYIPSFGDMWGWVCASKRVVNYNFDFAAMACIEDPLPFDHIQCLDVDDALRLLDNSSPKYLRT